jgi:hypothetical protein
MERTSAPDGLNVGGQWRALARLPALATSPLTSAAVTAAVRLVVQRRARVVLPAN